MTSRNTTSSSIPERPARKRSNSTPIDMHDQIAQSVSYRVRQSLRLDKPPEVNNRHMRPRQSPHFREADTQAYSCSNVINTARFGRWTWLPVSVWYQFRRAANQYFLVISILTCMPFSPKMPAPTVGTFAFVLLWTALKDWYEDNQRKKQVGVVFFCGGERDLDGVGFWAAAGIGTAEHEDVGGV